MRCVSCARPPSGQMSCPVPIARVLSKLRWARGAGVGPFDEAKLEVRALNCFWELPFSCYSAPILNSMQKLGKEINTT